MKNLKYYSKHQILELLEGEYTDTRSSLNFNFMKNQEDHYSFIIFKDNALQQIYDVRQLEDLYWANNLIMETYNATDFIMGACRYNGLPFVEYEKIRQTIIRSFI
jgi:hypothetical protein